jgi:2-dehydro-3-deoxyphosphogluconate aldolase/(4S)-4-hydroxy-2-oxoglutarate aldolase
MEDMKAAIRKEKIIAIVRGIPGEQIIKTVGALRDGGIRFVEVTYNQSSPSCMDEMREVLGRLCCSFPDLSLGAGTVLSPEQVANACQAGARYIISPNFRESVVKKTLELGALSIPGAMTPTEIEAAHAAGAVFVKLFPASDLGAGYVRSVRAPLSHVPLVATGGIHEGNMAEFFRSGACAFGIGGNLVDKKTIAAGNFTDIARTAERYVATAAAL